MLESQGSLNVLKHLPFPATEQKNCALVSRRQFARFKYLPFCKMVCLQWIVYGERQQFAIVTELDVRTYCSYRVYFCELV